MSRETVDYTSPAFWGRLAGRAFGRSWGRDVMLYTGGVSFFALLAVFPAIAILIGFYKVVLTTGQATAQAAALAEALPYAARVVFENEVTRLTTASTRTVSAQSAIALVIGAYAAHRGFKALLAGLNLIHDEKEPHGFFRFNMLAFVVALFAFGLFTLVSGAVVTARIMQHAAGSGGGGVHWDQLWPPLGLALGLTCLYRYAMSHKARVAWRPAVAGGLVATAMSMVFSWLCAIYVEQIVHLGATYGSVGAVVILLIWLSWNVNAVFYGGAFATELEILARRAAEKKTTEHKAAEPTSGAGPASAEVVSLSLRRSVR